MTIKGMIRRIRLINFMAFNDCTLNAGEYLNLVIGPNGSGKSSILCGVILGLGGSPKITGRSKKLTEYIRNNHDQAQIEICLYMNDSGSNLVTISRIITKKNESTFTIDDRIVDIKILQKYLADEYHIQIENLCQFLPQERVQDFAKMNQKELLVSTLKAICRLDVLEKQTNVIELNQKLKQLQNSSINDADNLKNCESQLSIWKEKVDQFEERKDLMNKIKHLHGKTSWMNYEEIMKQLDQIKKDQKKASKQLSDLQKKLNPLKEQLNRIKIKVNKYSTDHSKQATSINKSIAEVKNKIESCMTQRKITKEKIIHVDKCHERNKSLKNEIMEINKSIENEERKLEDLVQKFGSTNIASELKEYKNKCNEIEEQLKNIICEKRSIEFQLEAINISDKQLRMEKQKYANFKQIQLENLRKFDADAYSAFQWIKSNQNLFHSSIYGPIISELDVFDSANTKYIEFVIPFQDLSAFVCTDKGDVETLVRNLRGEQKLIINVMYFSEDNLNSVFKSRYLINNLKKYGLNAYISEFFDAPPLVKTYLCRSFNLHNIPVGDNEVNSRFNQLPSDITLFFSDKYKYTIHHSIYSKEKTTKTIEIRSRNIIMSKNHHRVKEMDRELCKLTYKKEKFEQKLDQINKMIEEKDVEKNKIVKKIEDLTFYESECNIIRSKIKKLKQRCKHIESEIVNESDARIRVKQNFKSFIDFMKNNFKENEKLLKDLLIMFKNSMIFKIEIDVFNKKGQDLKDQMYILNAKITENERICENIDKKLDKTKQKATQELTVAKKYTNNITYDMKAFKQFREIYDKLPGSLDEIKSELDRTYAKCKCMNIDTENVFEEYEKKKKEIIVLKKSMEKNTLNLEQSQEEFNIAKKEWLIELEQLIYEINYKFTDFFNRLNCKGQITIYRGKDEQKYDDYGISIQVTYRSNEPLKELDRFVQSGGERAVATAIYLLSLQDLTKAPFRWVDEINQGMDPTNELKIFQFLVEATSHKNSQYFFITPKLVKNLHISKNTRLHIILNGACTKKCENQEEHIPRKKRKNH